LLNKTRATSHALITTKPRVCSNRLSSVMRYAHLIFVVTVTATPAPTGPPSVSPRQSASFRPSVSPRAHTHGEHSQCRYRASCRQLIRVYENRPSPEDTDHTRKFSHPDPTPCLSGAACPLTTDENHRNGFIHPCTYGIACRNDTLMHRRNYSH
jgi:hypothetical protein